MKTLKKINNSLGFAHIELFIAVVVIAAIAGAGYFVYQNHTKTNVSHAAGWSSLGKHGNISVSACATPVSGFGGGWKVEVRFIKSADTPSNTASYEMYLNDVNGHLIGSTVQNGDAYFNNTVAILTTYVNKPLNQTFSAGSTKEASYVHWYPGYLLHC